MGEEEEEVDTKMTTEVDIKEAVEDPPKAEAEADTAATTADDREEITGMNNQAPSPKRFNRTTPKRIIPRTRPPRWPFPHLPETNGPVVTAVEKVFM